jgi:multisubunit Na+/H+ antiporter MnhB subunit
MILLSTICLILAFLCFGYKAIRPTYSRFELTNAGYAFVVLAFLLAGRVAG